MTAHLPSPSDHGRELVLTDEQARIVLAFYRLDPVTGDFTHRRARLEMAKGWGKSPLLAAVALAEFAGPVRFGGWDDDGEPVGVPVHWPVVEVAAVSLDQADNTWAALYEMLGANDGRAARELGIDAGRTRMYLTGGRPGHLRPVTAESSSREGARLTFAVLDETHLWRRDNGGVRLAAALRRNAAKMDGRTWETTNAPVTGQGSVAEESGDAAVPGVLHVCRRPGRRPSATGRPSACAPSSSGCTGTPGGRRSSGSWPRSRTRRTTGTTSCASTSTSGRPGRSRAVDPGAWDALERAVEVPDGARVALGFDGSLSLDSTVLRACTPDGHSFSPAGLVVGPPHRRRDARLGARAPGRGLARPARPRRRGRGAGVRPVRRRPDAPGRRVLAGRDHALAAPVRRGRRRPVRHQLGPPDGPGLRPLAHGGRHRAPTPTTATRSCPST